MCVLFLGKRTTILKQNLRDALKLFFKGSLDETVKLRIDCEITRRDDVTLGDEGSVGDEDSLHCIQ